MDESQIFLAALAYAGAAERTAYLDRACAGNPELRSAVEALLRARAEDPEFLERPAPGVDRPDAPGQPTADFAPGGGAGLVIAGRYKLLERIGGGGMGEVWTAQQTEPVRRVVAVKLIRAGMDSRAVVARFEAERQALALMDHPNIAKVLDGGTTGRTARAPAPSDEGTGEDACATDRTGECARATGRPFFVMELVKGVPITRYCDAHRLTPRQRLELFVPVCHAIQHAHQKGIIHRDLKPSNVLVASYDGRPVPKVIDFGVAKAAGQPLTEQTLVTGFGTVVGTLEYMSPEQAEFNQLDIDTRSDIYSLGVLLYELLTGSPPFSRRELEKAGLLEMLRVIREQEPSKPSMKLSTAEGLPALAADRGTEPAKLTRLVRGELDWIVMKALEKDRSRRYETANGFAMDVQRYLTDKPVLACPPSPGYRLRKFARRNRSGLLVAGLVLFFLVVLGSGAGWAVRDRSAREAAAARQRAKVAGQVESLLAEADRLEREQKWPEALAAARRAEAVVAGSEAGEETAERVRRRLKGLAFIDRLEQIRMDRAAVDSNQADRDYARAFRDYGVDVEELPVEASIEHLKARPGLAIPIAAALDHWVSLRDRRSGPWTRAVAVARGIDPDPLRDRLRSTWGQPITPDAAAELRRLADSIDVRAHHPATIYSLANVLRWANHQDAAVRVLREARSANPGDFWLNYELGYALYFQQDSEGAIRFSTAAVSLRPGSAGAHHNLGLALVRRHRADEAVACFRKAVELDPKKVSHHLNLGDALRDHQNKVGEALGCYRTALDLDPNSAYARVGLGYALALLGSPDEALAAYEEALRIQPSDAYVHHTFGCFLRDIRRDYGRAGACLRRAIELDPEYARSAHVCGDLCQVLGLHGKPDEGMAVIEAVRRSPTDDGDLLAHCLSALAWGLVTYPEPAQCDPGRAVSLAREAVELKPAEGIYHITLGAALYRAADWNAALESLERGDQLTGGRRLGYSAFFMAMSHWRLGNKDEARRWYDRAVKWTDQYGPRKEVLRRFRAEAAESLELSPEK